MRAAILAGGAASRFDGQPKGLELVGGERILDRVIRVVTTATDEPPFIVANSSEAPSWRDDLEVVGDVELECGSLGGILTALSTSDGPVLVVAWDMPFVSEDLLRLLVAGWKSYDVYLPSSEGPLGVEPLCGVYGPTCLESIKRSIAEEDFRTTAFHDEVRVGRVSLEDIRKVGDPSLMFFNVNAPEDLEQADGLWRQIHQSG